MGAEEREPQPDLKATIGRLENEARRFSYFRLVYLLERMGLRTGIDVGALLPTADFLTAASSAAAASPTPTATS